VKLPNFDFFSHIYGILCMRLEGITLTPSFNETQSSFLFSSKKFRIHAIS
jgi:hypothetical protein